MGVRSLGDRQDEDRDTERLEGEFVIRKNTGTAQTPRPGGAGGGGGGCAHRGALLAWQKADTLVSPSYLLPASHLLGEPTLRQRAGAWALGPGTGRGSRGGSGSQVCVGAAAFGSMALGSMARAAPSAALLTPRSSAQGWPHRGACPAAACGQKVPKPLISVQVQPGSGMRRGRVSAGSVPGAGSCHGPGQAGPEPQAGRQEGPALPPH